MLKTIQAIILTLILASLSCAKPLDIRSQNINCHINALGRLPGNSKLTCWQIFRSPEWWALQYSDIERQRAMRGTGELAPKGRLQPVLQQGDVIVLNETLEIGPGQYLETAGLPKPNQYQKMARLVRGNNFNGPLVKVLNGGRLSSVWVDGNSDNVQYKEFAINVQTLGDGSIVENCRIERTAGFSNIQALGALEGIPCSAAYIRGNFIIGRKSGEWSDGITAACENSIIEDNQIFDASDVAIVIFNAPPGQRQNTRLVNNRIFNHERVCFAAIGFDILFAHEARDFSGVLVQGNRIEGGFFRTMISLGTYLWGGSPNAYGIGGTVRDNYLSGFTYYGITHSGLRNVSLTNNQTNVKFNKWCGNSPAAIQEINRPGEFNCGPVPQ